MNHLNHSFKVPQSSFENLAMKVHNKTDGPLQNRCTTVGHMNESGTKTQQDRRTTIDHVNHNRTG
jgi:hypothetical protein